MKRGRFYNTNQYIRAEKVRVIDQSGKQIGVLPLRQALNEAQKAKLDLVEVAPKAKPPVCKIVDFRKFIYEERKKKLGNTKKKRRADSKQIGLGLFIGEHDLKRAINKAEEFLKKGDRVRLTIFFKGRQITKQEFGFELLKKVSQELNKVARVTQAPKLKGKILSMALEPKDHGQNQNQKSN